MNRKKMAVFRLVISVFLFLPTVSLASETYVPPPVPQDTTGGRMWKKALKYGKEIFEDPKLGRNGKSCTTCHDGSKLKGVTRRYPKYVEMADRVVTLGHMINYCINGALKGTELGLDSTKLIALQAYLKTMH